MCVSQCQSRKRAQIEAAQRRSLPTTPVIVPSQAQQKSAANLLNQVVNTALNNNKNRNAAPTVIGKKSEIPK
jgi:hypothetical protein